MKNNQETADNDPEELVEKLQVRFSIFDQAGGVNDENGSEEQDESEVGDVDESDGVARLDEDTTEKASVAGVGIKQEDPNVGQEGQRAEKAWRGIMIKHYMKRLGHSVYFQRIWVIKKTKQNH